MLSNSILYFIFDLDIIHSYIIFIKYKGLEMTNFEKVKKFMETFSQEVKEKASFSDPKLPLCDTS